MSESALELISRAVHAPANARILLLTPGPHGEQWLPQLLNHFEPSRCYVLESSLERLKQVDPSAYRIRAQAIRMPFQPRSFDAVIALECIYAIRPPWTFLAEAHRALVRNGTLVVLEPASQTFFSVFREQVWGPGKRVYPPEELHNRIERADFAIRASETRTLAEYKAPAFFATATKIEFDAGPTPIITTAREMIARRQSLQAQAQVQQ